MHNGYLTDLIPKATLELLEKIGAHGASLDVRTFAVGGIVRDLILERELSDIDITIEGNGITFTRRFVNENGGAYYCFPRFGTATMITPEQVHVDVTTARVEGYPVPGALPVVTNSDLRSDLRRRDFTINAMAMSLNAEDFGRLYDPFEGMFDLQNGIIRFLHEKSFIDDPTRVLRCVRFATRFSFDIDSKTLQYLRHAVNDNALNTVSGERIFQELEKGSMEDEPELFFRLLDRFEILKHIDRDLVLSDDIVKVIENVQAFRSPFRNEFPKHRWKSWLVYLLALTAHLPEHARDRISGKLRMPGIYARTARKLENLSLLSETTWARMTDGQAALVMRSLIPEALWFLQSKLNKKVILDYIQTHRDNQIILNGGDLLDLGVELGPDLGYLLDLLYMKRIDDGVSTREQEIDIIEKYLREKADSDSPKS